MGLSAHGKPEYMDEFKKIIDIKPDGSFYMDPSYFTYIRGADLYNKKFIKLFGEPRDRNERLNDRHRNIAASLQKTVEEATILMAKSLYERTKLDNICLAGGFFLNCVANHKILEKTEFKNIFIQPAAGDTGGALGAAVYVSSRLDQPRKTIMKHAYWGPSYSDKMLQTVLENGGFTYKRYEDEDLFKFVAEKISKNKTIGWFQGRMEYGPRALGNRSILGNPCNPEMKDILNFKIKSRESFRPYAPAVLEEKSLEYFKLKSTSPFMTLAAEVREEVRNKVPAITHVDGTARIQTVSRTDAPRFWKLISEFEKISGVPILLNTSFNLRDYPIVCWPKGALCSFQRTQMDYLVLENYVVLKDENRDVPLICG